MTRVLAVAAAVALPTVAAWPLVSGLWAAGRPCALQRLGKVAAAAMAGLGIVSLASFFWLLAGGTLGRSYVAAEVPLLMLLWLALTAWRRRVTRREQSQASAAREPVLPSGSVVWNVLATALVGVALAFALWRLIRIGADHPHGGWDAWAIWNHRARFIFRAGEDWREAFVPELSWSHVDYPLLLPLSVARIWAYAGETTLAPAVVAALFTLAAAATLAAGVAASAGPVAGATAAILLLGTPGYVHMGASQYADVPLGALLVVALVALLEAERTGFPGRARALVLGGLFLGFAGWTKNEGLTAAAIVVLARTLLSWRVRGLAASLRELVPLAAGAALPAAAWLAFHWSVAPPWAEEFIGQNRTALAQHLMDGDRWSLILSGVAKVLPGAELHLLAVAAGLAILLGARPRGVLRSPAFVSAALLYAAVVAGFLVTPKPLAWHLATAADRLAMQPWPVLLLGLLASAAPEAGRAARESNLE
ncbi:hypothetical protein [Anaeromyxobacter oryzisoli]|uniref:hypothetical protein n=1 Tax=Anaeromyxobacter oryzisoli TaxID=2925408 RepID=UPI001F56A41B|nr:hypothetical protein [Anaeromyxobacter sp. SG63]